MQVDSIRTSLYSYEHGGLTLFNALEQLRVFPEPWIQNWQLFTELKQQLESVSLL
jgi:hypothetical protein